MRLPSRKPSPPKKQKASGKHHKKGASRFALLIGDEGAILVHIVAGKVQSRQFAAECAPDSTKDFLVTLTEHPKDKIGIYLDTLDQSYIQQTLPPVSSLSIAKLIKRRLDREFPSTILKGSVLLGREEGERKDWNFLMVALEQSPAVKDWIDWVVGLPNRCTGIFALPVESEFLLKKYYQAQKEDIKQHPWTFIVSHNKVSGFRQIVLQKDKMIFTRLGQPLSDDNVAVAAGIIEQEILSTMEYLKRFSLKDSSAIDLIIMASGEILQSIDAKKFNANSAALLSPHQLAEILELSETTQPSDRFGDVVWASVLSGVSKPRLKLWTPIFLKLEKTYGFIFGLRALTFLLALALIGYASVSAYDYWNNSSDISDLQQSRRIKEEAYANLRLEASKMAGDMDKLSDTIAVYDTLKEEAYTPTPFLVLLSQALAGVDVRVNVVEWGIADPKATPKIVPSTAVVTAEKPVVAPAKPLPTGNEKVEGRIEVEFLNAPLDQDQLKNRTDEFLSLLKQTFPPYDFQYTRLQGLVKENEKVEFDSKQINKEKIPVIADIAFRGPVILSTDQVKRKKTP